MAPTSTFINYSHPSEQNERQNRRTVASYIGTHYRNRSKPSARLQRDGEKSSIRGQNKPKVEVPSQASAVSVPRLPWQKAASPEEKGLTASKAGDNLYLAHDKHGFRSDPFSTYPIQPRAHLSKTVDFFLRYYGPAHLICPENLSAEAGTLVIRQIFQYAMDDALLFEAMMAVSQAGMTARCWSVDGPDKDALLHYNRTVSRLRSLLDQNMAYSQDAVLFAIVALMGVDYLLNDMVAYGTHIEGMRRIIALRGGLDKLGWPTILKPLVISVESFWTYICTNPPQPEASSPDVQPPPSATADYVDIACPYVRKSSADLFEMIQGLPLGFRRLALNYRRSVPVMALIYGVVSNNDEIHAPDYESSPSEVNAANHQEWLYCLRLLSDINITPVERTCCIGLMLTIVDRSHSAGHSPHYRQQIRHHAKELSSGKGRFLQEDVSDMFLWVSLNIVGRDFQKRAQEQGSGLGEDDKIELLLVLVRRHAALKWDDVLARMNNFIPAPRQEGDWRYAWQLGHKLLWAREACESPMSSNIFVKQASESPSLAGVRKLQGLPEGTP
ncbi:hypothetical protein PV10_03613 [Exophiala mesophila]|uniref:Transcription factor domain-containing protein n=1 Tax=Exophiala mesophila TaxID=212818 RepID=A0A0D1Y5X1_EXOME|nr:uncharacterized protein PV10_03613 [Exophiala mesophila]KIV96031.1 hypothetical protein PV10_03613 [Exophiala mesophila]